MVGILCRSEAHKKKMESAAQRIGEEAFRLLFQARGWAARWIADPHNEVHDIIVRDFIDKVDALLCLRDVQHSDMREIPDIPYRECTELYGRSTPGPTTKMTALLREEDAVGRSIKPVPVVRVEQEGQTVLLESTHIKHINDLLSAAGEALGQTGGY